MLINFQGVHQFGLFLVTRTLFCGKDMLGELKQGTAYNKVQRWGAWPGKKTFFVKTISTNTDWKHIISREIIRNAKS